MTVDTSYAERTSTTGRNPWWWVPSLYFAEGVPYVVVMTVAVIMFKRLGVGNAQIALYTSWLYLPYAIKPLWSPLVQRIGTRRSWVVVMQLLIAAGLACAALAIPLDSFLRWSLVALAAVAISSATHDVAADGFYLLALSSHQQAWFVGIRSTAYRAAMIFGQGLLVMLAGMLESSTGLPTLEVEVRATDREAGRVQFEPEALIAIGDSGPQRIELAGEVDDISFRGRPAAEAKSILVQVRNWNVEHGFYAGPERADANNAAAEGENRPPGWRVALEDFIRSRFGPRSTAKELAVDRAGDVAPVIMRLTQPVPPGEQQVVQFGRARGDASFQVVEGERFVLTAENWNRPFAAAVQVDPKLDHQSQATFEVRSGNLRFAWTATFFVIAAAFVLSCVYHFVALPRPAADVAFIAESTGERITGFIEPFVDFFRKPRILATLAFLLLYRFPEAQLVKLATPFLLDSREAGGLALTTGEVGFVYGTVGVIMLTLGGIIGGFVAARDGLKLWLWPMALAIHLPNLAFLFLAYVQPENIAVITTAVGVEQFGYGFGFTAYLLYSVYVARGKHETVHYALCTGCMALGMMIPGMWSGWLEELIGYQHFFVWIMLAMIPSLLAVAFITVDPQFGKKSSDEATG
ncbi:MAG: MFS transporter [Planctomycetes bacterium]|nr:MFS transporter [Planctomycetota bacterium]